MNKTYSSFIALFLAAAMPVAALAQPRMISDLSDGALIGPISSTAQLKKDFDQNEPLIAQAGAHLGLSAQDVRDVHRAVDRGQAKYVELPQRLDGMAGAHDGVAFAVHDIRIPAGVYGWEVDLRKPAEVVRVFVPNRCGNVSYLRVPLAHVVAKRPSPYHFAFVPAPAPSVARIAYAPAIIGPRPVVVPAPSPTPEVVAMTAPLAVSDGSSHPVPVAAAAHHFAFLPWLAAALVGIALASHGGSAHAGTAAVITAQPTPIPLHTACPGP